MKINLASTRLAFFLIASLLFLILISAIIPQEGIAAGQIIDWHEKLGDSYIVIEKLGLDRIYYTPTFFIVLGLLAINLAAGNIRRFKFIYKTEKTLLKLRHIGSIIFHLSLLAVMTGVILHFLYQYHGVMALTEGQTMPDEAAIYFREYKGPLCPDDYGNFSLSLDSVSNLPDDLLSPGSAASIRVVPPDSKPIEGTIQTNHPLNWRDWEFHYGPLSGYSPELTITDTTGNSIFRAFVRVAHTKHPGVDIHSDHVMIPGQNMKISIEVIPGKKPPETITYQIETKIDSLTIYAGLLEQGQVVSFDNYRLSVSRLRRWCYINAIRNPFLGLIFAAFWSALVGMVIGFIPRVMAKG